MKILESIATICGIILLWGFVVSVRSCQCDHRAGNGIESTFHPIYGCQFQVKE